MNCKIQRFESIASTNDYAKSKRSEGQNLLVIAASQTGGRGTKGRRFSSTKGGLYLSKLSFYENFPAKDAFKIMQTAAAAVCETLASFGLLPKIKWANDVFVNGKKICGILIENTFSGANIASSVVGIGLNVYNEIPEELKNIATTMQKETGKTFPIEEVEKRLVACLADENTYKKYDGYLGWLGETVEMLSGEERLFAKLLSVDETGGLWVETDGEKRRFTSAEISLKI